MLRKRTFVFKSLPAFAANIPSICRFQRPLPFNRTRALAELEAKPAEYAQNVRVLECPLTSLLCPHPLHASLSESPCITSNASVLLDGSNAGIVCPGSESLCSTADQPSVPTSSQCVTSRVHFPKIQTLVSRQQGRQKVPRKRTIEIIFLPAFAAHMQSMRFQRSLYRFKQDLVQFRRNASIECPKLRKLPAFGAQFQPMRHFQRPVFKSSNTSVMKKGGDTRKWCPGKRLSVHN